ncbi:penicillin-binding transpeptidase domain-containing protein [Streptomyces coryli]|nr:penicillin-binding transpeptidase domain-containing protein [Streptomyces coryli]
MLEGQNPSGGGSHAAAREGMPAKTKAVVIGVACAAVIGAAGFAAYSLTGSDGGDSGSGSTAAGSDEGDKPKVKTGPPSAKEVRTTANAFLTAWAKGDPAKAAKLTDAPTEALAALKSYRTDAHVAKVAAQPGARSGTKVPYAVSAQVDYKGKQSPWKYSTALEVARDKKTGEPKVTWQPTVLHPKLGEGEKLMTGEAEKAPIKAVDRDGKPLDPKAFPSLGAVVDSLRDKYGDKAGGTAGIETWVEPSAEEKKDDAKAVAPETLLVLSKGTPGTLKTTIDSAVQKTTEAAVAKTAKASMVVIKPSTGEILGVANKPGGGFNSALQGSMAPGSTMKVITASMLIEKDLAHSTETHPCPKYKEYGGWKFQNVEEFELPKDATFAQSFANSCNTAFISMAEKLKNDDLTKQARDVFGIGLNWQTGVSSFDGRVPVQADAQMAASLIGQGGVRMNPLNMASVSATIKDGTFKQPYLIAPSLDKRTLAKAPRQMSAATLGEMRGLMKQVAQWGTGAKAMSGLGGTVGAKTGSAEVDGQKKPNAWFTAYRNDIAAAAVVPESGHGGDFAGPLVKQVLAAHG